MTLSASNPNPQPLPLALPPLENGDPALRASVASPHAKGNALVALRYRLTRHEFERRYDTLPHLRKAEL